MRASAASAASPRPWRVHHMGSPTPLLLSPSTSSIASNAAFLSALLPPLPSPPPSDLILYFQEPEHQEPAAPELVRKRPAPDVYLLPPPRHVTGDLFVFDVTAPTGGSAAVPPVMLSLPVQGPATQRRRQSYGVMLTLHLQSSEPVSSDDLDEAQRELVTPFCTSTHRVTAYFAEAMLDRLVSSCHDICLYAPLPHASYPAASRLAKSRTTAAFQTFSPFAKFSRFKAKQATQEAFEGQDLGDIHHITIMEGLQCPGLADILASRTRGPPRVRLTVLGASMEALEAMLARLVTSCHDICLYVPLPHASYPAAYLLAKSRTTAAFQTSNAISRFAKFSHFKARQAIKDKEEFERQDLGHIHRIMIMQGLQWPGLAHILASRTRGQPRVRLTVLGASMEALEATGKQTSDFAKVLFYKFCSVAYTPGNLDSEKLDANDSNTLCLVQSITFIDQSPEKFANLQFNFSFNDQQVTKNEMKWALEKHDDGEELSQTNPGLNTTPLGFVKCSNTHTPGCESHKEKTICDLDEKCEYELPKVCLRVENREKHKKKEKAKSRLFTTLKVTGIRNRTRYLLLLVLFCTFITAVGSSSRAERSRQGFCPKPDVIQLLFPPHQIVCPVVDISSVHWTHSKRSVPHKNQQWEGICELIVLIVSVICSCGPWYSVYTLQPVQGKKYKFLFYFKVEPARMWYFTLAASINYYASMVAYGVMLNSDHKCGTWVPNAIYCSMFLLCVAFLCCREKMIFQVGNLVLLVTCVCCVAGAGLIGLVHWLCIRLHPAEFEKIFYFEKIAFSCLIAMYIFRGFTMEPTPLNFFLNILAAFIPLSLLCTDVHHWYRFIVIFSSAGRIFECGLWATWLMLGWNPIIVIEHENP